MRYCDSWKKFGDRNKKKVETLNDARKNPDTPKEYLNSRSKVDKKIETASQIAKKLIEVEQSFNSVAE